MKNNVIESVIMLSMSAGDHKPGLFKGDNGKITFMDNTEDIIKSAMHFGTKPIHMHLGIKFHGMSWLPNEGDDGYIIFQRGGKQGYWQYYPATRPDIMAETASCCSLCGTNYLPLSQRNRSLITTANQGKCCICNLDRSLISIRHYNYLRNFIPKP